MNAIVPEFSRSYALSTMGALRKPVSIVASEDERRALALRFSLAALDRLEAIVTLAADGDAMVASGRMTATLRQYCAATGEPVAASIAEPLLIRFVPPSTDDKTSDEIEIDPDDADIVEHDGQSIDLGEAVAQSLALALDPFPRAPGASETLRAAGVVGEDEIGNGAFADLKAMLGSKTLR